MTTSRFTVLALAAVLASGCATWSTDVRSPGEKRVPSIFGRSLKTGRTPTDPAKVALVEGDVKDKPYDAIADISIAVRNTTFYPVPTHEMLAQRLREEAAKLGADAVVNVHYDDKKLAGGRLTPPGASGRAVVYK
jgi:hypothetical protein